MCVARRLRVTIVAKGCARTIARAASTDRARNASLISMVIAYPHAYAPQAVRSTPISGRPQTMGDREERPDERDAEDGGHNKIGSRNVDEEAEHDERGEQGDDSPDGSLDS